MKLTAHFYHFRFDRCHHASTVLEHNMHGYIHAELIERGHYTKIDEDYFLPQVFTDSSSIMK